MGRVCSVLRQAAEMAVLARSCLQLDGLPPSVPTRKQLDALICQTMSYVAAAFPAGAPARWMMALQDMLLGWEAIKACYNVSGLPGITGFLTTVMAAAETEAGAAVAAAATGAAAAAPAEEWFGAAYVALAEAEELARVQGALVKALCTALVGNAFHPPKERRWHGQDLSGVLPYSVAAAICLVEGGVVSRVFSVFTAAVGKWAQLGGGAGAASHRALISMCMDHLPSLLGSVSMCTIRAVREILQRPATFKLFTPRELEEMVTHVQALIQSLGQLKGLTLEMEERLQMQALQALYTPYHPKRPPYDAAVRRTDLHIHMSVDFRNEAAPVVQHMGNLCRCIQQSTASELIRQRWRVEQREREQRKW